MQVAPGAPPVSRRLSLAVLAAVVAGLDQAAKAWAVGALGDGDRVELVGSAVQLRLVRNSGSAFSIFTGGTPVLGLLALVLVVILVRMAGRESDPWLLAGLALVLGGALGNLADRFFRAPGFLEGSVVDFVDVGAWPTFNVADAAISVGAVAIVLRGWRDRDRHPAPPDGPG